MGVGKNIVLTIVSLSMERSRLQPLCTSALICGVDASSRVELLARRAQRLSSICFFSALDSVYLLRHPLAIGGRFSYSVKLPRVPVLTSLTS